MITRCIAIRAVMCLLKVLSPSHEILTVYLPGLIRVLFLRRLIGSDEDRGDDDPHPYDDFSHFQYCSHSMSYA